MERRHTHTEGDSMHNVIEQAVGHIPINQQISGTHYRKKKKNTNLLKLLQGMTAIGRKMK